MEELYTVNELSDKLKYSRSTIYRWLSEGSISCQRIGRQIRFTGNDVIKIINQKATTRPKEQYYGYWPV
jgi:excisionase family DNA binding protein